MTVTISSNNDDLCLTHWAEYRPYSWCNCFQIDKRPLQTGFNIKYFKWSKHSIFGTSSKDIEFVFEDTTAVMNPSFIHGWCFFPLIAAKIESQHRIVSRSGFHTPCDIDCLISIVCYRELVSYLIKLCESDFSERSISDQILIFGHPQVFPIDWVQVTLYLYCLTWLRVVIYIFSDR